MKSYPTKIVNNEVVINGVPWSKWTEQEWGMWKQNTNALTVQVDRIINKLAIVARNKGWVL